LYRTFIADGIGKDHDIWPRVVGQIYLGGQRWIEQMRTRVESKPRCDEHPRAQREIGRPQMPAIVAAVAKSFETSVAEIRKPGASVTIGGTAATSITVVSPTQITATTPAHAAGAVNVVVTNADAQSATLASGFTYVAFGAPSSFSATATSASQVALSWAAVSGATSYEVWRSSLNGPYSLALSPAGTSANDTGLSADTTYLYRVRAIGGAGSSGFSLIDPATTIIFTDPNLSGVFIQAVHINELRTAVNAMRAAAGLQAAVFTDSTLITGGTIIKAAHVSELRTALDAARWALGLPAISYTDPAITAGVTVMKAAHLTELRSGTQ
jgi:IPT/TIG domain